MHQQPVYNKSTSAVGANGTVYSSSSKFKFFGDNACCFKLVMASGGASTVTISQQCSTGDGNWYTPVNNSGGQLGVICTTFTPGTYWIQAVLVTAPEVRFKIEEKGGVVITALTLTLMFQEASNLL